MTNQDERLRVLQMVEAGSITAEEAARLLEAIEEPADPAAAPAAAGPARRLVVRIWDGKPETETPTVNLSLPVGLLEWGLKFAQHTGKAAGLEELEELEELNLDELQELVREGGRGEILRIDDGNDRVHIDLV